MYYIYSFCLIVMIFPYEILAQDINASCIQKNENERKECLKNIAEKQEIEMLMTLIDLKKRIPDEYLELDKQQRAWLKHRQSYCTERLNNSNGNNGQPGGIRCFNILTKERIDELKEFKGKS